MKVYILKKFRRDHSENFLYENTMASLVLRKNYEDHEKIIKFILRSLIGINIYLPKSCTKRSDLWKSGKISNLLLSKCGYLGRTYFLLRYSSLLKESGFGFRIFLIRNCIQNTGFLSKRARWYHQSSFDHYL